MLLDCADLSYTRGSGDQAFRVAIDSLTLDTGEIVALTGASGCGKSTALELLGLVVRPQNGGRFQFGAGDRPTDIADLWQRGRHADLARLRAAAIGFVLQTGGLLPYLNVAGNIGINRRLLRLPERDPDLDAIVAQLQIGHLLKQRPAQLSVGQYQRASIARALAHRPRLVLADEPTSALDPRLGDEVMELFLSLVERLGTSVILATHEHARVRARGLRQIQATPLAEGFGSRFAG
ncbi:ATP-binding cassette domain-containing protein [uncultured Thiodictyon sp.]|uniref:ABC transporter ATP-binding protein n=1 Tax=uncultured Thiodictyon sp. TaxID=1846217 RepID=UPI0025EA9004|nr:ATP-binding cassette domain-containing protein [uncultured Thiodictyon sp.]